MPFRRHLLIVMLAAAACSGNPPVLPVVQRGNTVRTRSELEQLVRDHEAALASPDYSEADKARLRAEVDVIRSRLEHGDFRVGDRIFLTVEGEPELPDTLIVAPGDVIELPVFGEISVAGVLRSELREHLTERLSTFINDPVVQANGLMRISVLGAVGDPGFFSVPAETVLGDAIMVAGGPVANANLEAVQISRGATLLMEDEVVGEALRQGLTLDQLNLVAGDQIEVPLRRGFVTTLSIVTGIIGSLSFIIWRFL
jgi:hypothetical protein